MIHAPRTTAVAGERRPPAASRPAGGGAGRATSAAAGRSACAARAAARKPAAIEGERQADAVAVGAERGDEHEQHGARHERLAAGAGVERERVGGEHGEARCRWPPAATSRRRTRPARRRRWNWSRTSAEVGPRDVPRLAGREDRGERRRDRRPSRPPTTSGERGEQRPPRSPGTWRRRSSSDEPWPTTTTTSDVGDELPVGEHPGEPEGGDERVRRQGDRGDEVERLAAVRRQPADAVGWRSPWTCARGRRHGADLGEDRVRAPAGRGGAAGARVLPARTAHEPAGTTSRCGRRRRAAARGGRGPSCRRRSA